MNRLINRCGNRRACCRICVQPVCCQPVAIPACCQPAGGEVKPPDAPAHKVPENPSKPDRDPLFKNGSNDVKTLRMWTDASGKYRVEAGFVSFRDGTVRLQKDDGRYVRIAYDRLCAVDQDFVLHQDQGLLARE
jgi:hypothetical protein